MIENRKFRCQDFWKLLILNHNIIEKYKLFPLLILFLFFCDKIHNSNPYLFLQVLELKPRATT